MKSQSSFSSFKSLQKKMPKFSLDRVQQLVMSSSKGDLSPKEISQIPEEISLLEVIKEILSTQEISLELFYLYKNDENMLTPWQVFSEICAISSALKTIEINMGYLTTNPATALKKILSNENLETVSLSYLALSQHAKCITERIVSNSNITTLQLRHNDIDFNKMLGVAELVPNSNITWLDISYNVLGNSAIKIAEIISQSTKLKYLNMSNTSLFDENFFIVLNTLKKSSIPTFVIGESITYQGYFKMQTFEKAPHEKKSIPIALSKEETNIQLSIKQISNIPYNDVSSLGDDVIPITLNKVA